MRYVAQPEPALRVILRNWRAVSLGSGIFFGTALGGAVFAVPICRAACTAVLTLWLLAGGQ